ncbi:MAG: hypothetical protein HY647_01020 [Acidobacteria bacterium]|nr:hypothetical protein [Acidobacteriota bacterium]
MREEALSFLMLFFTLLLIRNAKATWEQSLALVPLQGKAKNLAEQLSTGYWS